MNKFLFTTLLSLILNPAISLCQTCPSGTQPADFGTTRDPQTDTQKNFTCIDSTGNLSIGIIDNGGQLFNVKAYGATGNGVTDDSSAIQAAFNAAATSGGRVFFPCGNYLIGSTVNQSTFYNLSVEGENDRCVSITLSATPTVGFTLTAPSNAGVNVGAVLSNFHFTCNQTSQTGFQLTDFKGNSPHFSQVVVSGCGTAFDVKNVSQWNERLVFDRVTDDSNTHFIHFDQSPSDANNSYAYGSFEVYVNGSGTDVFQATRGANIYSSSGFTVLGNPQGQILFDGPPASGQQGNTFSGKFNVFVEGTGTVFDTHNVAGSLSNSQAVGAGYVRASGLTYAVANSNVYVSRPDLSATFYGSFTTTAATSETFSTASGANSFESGVHCFVMAENSTAAGLTGVSIGTVGFGTVVVNHSATAGGIFGVWCYPGGF